MALWGGAGESIACGVGETLDVVGRAIVRGFCSMSYLPKLARDRRSGDGRRRRRRPRRGVATPSPALDRLEVRRLLAGGVVGLSSLALAGVAAPLTIGGSSVGTVDSRGAVYYEITAPEDGRLTIRIDMADFPARLALLDSGGGTLVQSDGATSGGQGALIDEHISANTTYYVQIKSGGGGGSYRIQADLTDSGPPFQPISANLLGGCLLYTSPSPRDRG